MIADESKATSLGPAAFQDTQWTKVIRTRDLGASQAGEALNHLCKAYWYPLYSFIRRNGIGPEDAKDFTQSFLADFTRRECLAHVDPSKGKFRSFLLACLKNFLANERQRSSAAKRGGNITFVAFSTEDAERRYEAEPAASPTADTVFDRSWAVTILDNALATLRLEYERAGKLALFESIQPCLCGDRDGSNASVASQLGISEGAVKMSVMRMRRRFGQLLRAQVAETVASDADLEEELRYLFAVLGS